MRPRPLIIDCDPGVDDAIALLLAIASREALSLLGITTVAGNVPLALTEKNARRIVALSGQDIPVYAGCPRPLMRPLETAEYVHGETGLGQVTLPEPQQPCQAQHGVNFLIETLTQAPEPVTLAALGPLTNLAIALIQAPQIGPKIAEIVIMGGAITHGNVTPVAEFNLYNDPHAAQIVLSSGCPITLISLDVTHRAIATPQRVAALRNLGSPVALVVADLLETYGDFYRDRYGFEGAALHDPCVIAYLLKPDLFRGKACPVTVDTAGPLTCGQSIVDWWHLSGQPANALVLETVDADGFYRLLTNRLARYSASTP